MEFIRSIKEKRQTARQNELMKEAEHVIALSDFANTLYITYNNTPIIAIANDWTPERIIKELAKIRSNYVNARVSSIFRGAAAL